MKKIVDLRTGRVYLIKPDPLPGFRKKERPGLYMGYKFINGVRKHLFIQIGTSQVNNKIVKDFSEKTKYFWDKMKSDGYFHIDISKYEYIRVVSKPYKNEGKYIEINHNHLQELKIIYLNRIRELESIRLSKAKKLAFSGKEKESIRQLKLLKMAMPEKHKRMKPEALVKKWKMAFDSI